MARHRRPFLALKSLSDLTCCEQVRGRLLLLSVLFLVQACDRRSATITTVVAETPTVETLTPVASAAMPTPTALPTPPRALTAAERDLVGTWVAIVDERASQSRKLSGMVAFDLPKGKDFITGTMEAIEKKSGYRMATSCVSLELYDNLTGFRNECTLTNGRPSLLMQNDLFTGEKTPFGIAFDWATSTKGLVHIVFADDMILPPLAGEEHPTTFRKWDLRLQGPPGGSVRVKETFPEHAKRPALQYEWSLTPGSISGK